MKQQQQQQQQTHRAGTVRQNEQYLKENPFPKRLDITGLETMQLATWE